MPTLTLRITPLHNPPHYAVLAHELTLLTQQVLRKNPEVTVVMIEDMPAARFYVGGQAAQQTAACLEIDITEGTNSVQDKENFVAQAYALLERILGSLHRASYVIIRELPAQNWGYAGVTQHQRRQLSLAPAPVQ